MTETEKLRQEIGNLLWEYWDLLPEPKQIYTKWHQKIDADIDSWSPTQREKRIADREEKS